MPFHRIKDASSFLTLIIFAVFLVGIQSQARSALADDAYTFIIKKQDEKEKYRWNLADWLNTRDRMRVQDLWLALHSPSPFEFYLGGNLQFNQLIPGGSQGASEMFAGAFSSIFGLEGRYEMSTPETRWFGIFNFRFFGYQDQSTNMTLQVGIRSTDDGYNIYRNALAGLSVTLYFSKYFGVEGLYRYYFLSTPIESGVQYRGERIQGGGFIEFRFLRIFGGYIVDNESTSNMTGAQIGTKIYF